MCISVTRMSGATPLVDDIPEYVYFVILVFVVNHVPVTDVHFHFLAACFVSFKGNGKRLIRLVTGLVYNGCVRHNLCSLFFTSRINS